jgi:hypothetical protein
MDRSRGAVMGSPELALEASPVRKRERSFGGSSLWARVGGALKE